MTAVTTVLPIPPQGSHASPTTPLPLVRSEVRLDPVVTQGPALLAGITAGPGLEAHRHRVGPAARPSADELVRWARAVDLRDAEVPGSPLRSSWSRQTVAEPWWW
jgi:hypothetical protein